MTGVNPHHRAARAEKMVGPHPHLGGRNARFVTPSPDDFVDEETVVG